jgi:hypothetical protein
MGKADQDSVTFRQRAQGQSSIQGAPVLESLLQMEVFFLEGMSQRLDQLELGYRLPGESPRKARERRSAPRRTLLNKDLFSHGIVHGLSLESPQFFESFGQICPFVKEAEAFVDANYFSRVSIRGVFYE